MYFPISDTNTPVPVINHTDDIHMHGKFLPRKKLGLLTVVCTMADWVQALHTGSPNYVLIPCITFCIVYIFYNRQAQFVTLSRVILLQSDFEASLTEQSIQGRGIMYHIVG
jgi:hypothetical protein